MSKSRKDDQGKLRWHLLPLPLVENLVKVYEFGANKYGENTWQKLEGGYDRCKAAMFRHLVSHEKGEILDPESGLPHLAHCAWNALAMLHFAKDEKKITFDVKCKDEVSLLLKGLKELKHK